MFPAGRRNKDNFVCMRYHVWSSSANRSWEASSKMGNEAKHRPQIYVGGYHEAIYMTNEEIQMQGSLSWSEVSPPCLGGVKRPGWTLRFIRK